MALLPHIQSEEQVDTFLSVVLRISLLIALITVIVGGALFLYRHGHDIPQYRIFHGEPRDLRGIHGIVVDVLKDRSVGITQLGILLIVATPLLRVIACLLLFGVQGDSLFVIVALIVFVALIYSLFWENPPFSFGEVSKVGSTQTN
jgi:uncharacterized membrane protein